MDPNSQFLLLITAIVFAITMVLESLIPQREQGPIAWRWVNNFSLGILTWYISTVASTWFLIWLADNQPISRFAIVPSSIAKQPLPGLLMLLLLAEFIRYWVHLMFHKVRFLWPIHAVHHADTYVDVSTSYRHHPLEPLIGIPIVTPALLLLGVGPESVAAFQILSVTVTVLSHANIRLPQTLENIMRPFIVTPGFHHLHHCSQRRYTDSNYGAVVPWFDFAFGTATTRPIAEQAEMEVGLEYWREHKDTRLDQQLLMPLRTTEPAQD